MSAHNTHEEVDANLIEKWIDLDPRRFAAGAAAGIFAAFTSMAVAIIFAKTFMDDALFPVKVPAVPLLGNVATDFNAPASVLQLGMGVHLLSCAILGAIYAHFTATNKVKSLLGYGFVWGCFSWIFIFNLFSKSFMEIRALNLHAGVGFILMQTFGLSLASKAFFDQFFRKN